MRTTYIFGTFIFISILLHWALGYPCALSYHEQNQLFCYTTEYFIEHALTPGGISNYLSEFLTQFYYYPLIGSIIIAALTTILYFISARILRLFTKCKAIAGQLALFLPISIYILMADEQVMLCYLVSLTIVIICISSWLRINKSLSVLITVILYLICGPLAILYPLFNIVDTLIYGEKSNKEKIIWILQNIVICIICLITTYIYINPKYPWIVIISGIFYYRAIKFDLEQPIILTAIPGIFVIIVGFSSLISPYKKRIQNIFVSIILICIIGIIASQHEKFYNQEKYSQLQQDYLIRRGQWGKLLEEAKKYQSQTALGCTGVNLSLAMTNQLPDKQFGYYQCGTEGLLISNQSDNIQMLPTMEAYYRMGLINIAMWYAFETQQAIPNQNQSARLTKRLAECNIIIGRYEVARKYIDKLKHTQFYDKWAKHAEKLLYNEDLITQHSEYGKLRRFLLNEQFDCLMPQQEIEKIIGRLVVQNNSNTIATQYYFSTLLLKGQREMYVSYLSQRDQRLENPFPKGYKEYYIRMCNQSKESSVDGASGASNYNK